MGLKPSRNARLSRRKRRARAGERDQDGETEAFRRRNPSGNDPVSSMRTVLAECRRPPERFAPFAAAETSSI